LEVKNKVNSLLKQKISTYEVIDINKEEGEILKELNIYVSKFMTYLWEQPQLIANIISSADKNDIKENLAPLFADNFFENILSQNYIEENLLYVLTLLLQKEINDIKDINDYSLFLNDSPCSFLLEELKEKKDVQTFFKLIISKAVEKLETSCSNKDLMFSLSKIGEEIQKNENDNTIKKNDNKNFFMKITTMKTGIIRNSINNNNNTGLSMENDSEIDYSRNTIFESNLCKDKYFTSSIKEKIIEKKEKYNNEKGNKNKDDTFYDIYLKKISSGDNHDNNADNYLNIKQNKYDNEEFLIDLDNDKKIKKIYLDNFYRVTECINIIFNNILDNLYFLPYSTKCLCKIISILIKKKFPNINILQHNAFISRFFFCKLFQPFFLNPTYEALITSFLISKKTLSNLSEISKILIKLIYGELFTNEIDTIELSPFNLFFIEKMPELLKIFDEIQKVTLPSFIEKLINNELPKDYKYEYFKENPEEAIIHRSICFKVEDISSLVRTIGLNEELYFSDKKNIGLKKTYEKLCSNSSKFLINEINKKQTLKRNLSLRESKQYFSFEKIKNKDNTSKIKESLLPKVYYFLISEFLINEKYKNCFGIEFKEPYFRTEELKTIENEKEIMENNLIRVKNCICSILYNYQYLVKKDFSKGTTNDTKSIFSEIKKFTHLNNFIINDKIPTQWFLNCLLGNLTKIPKEYINNDYELLYNTIEKDLNESIDLLNFDTMAALHEKMIFIERQKNNYEKKKKSLHKVKLNDKVNNIIEKVSIPIALYFDYKTVTLKIEKATISVKQLQIRDDLVIEDTKKSRMICKTIKIFTNEFPDLTKFEKFQDIDLFELEKNLGLPEKLQEYFDIIREHLEKSKLLNEKNINLIGEKIYDYIIGKIYDKIFPRENNRDDEIFRKTILLTWIEPKHFIVDKKNYIFDGFLPDVNHYLKKLEKQKSPRKKFNYMSKIFELIRNLVKFNGGDIMTGVDDQMPILNYSLIKSRPLRIYSNCKFMELFLGERRNKKEDSELIQLISLCDYICNISYSKLLNVTKEEYHLKCEEAAKNDNFQKS